MTFYKWKIYFELNRDHFSAIDFEQEQLLTAADKKCITKSLQQFQKGEQSEGRHLFAFAKRFADPYYLESIKLFICEEQRHAAVLGAFMKKQGIPFIKNHWVDGVFRWLRKLAGLENTVRILLIAEIIAKVYYKALYLATGSVLLKEICQQILKDEEQHIRFQCEALHHFYAGKSLPARFFIRFLQAILITGTMIVVWWHHRTVLKAAYTMPRFFSETFRVFMEADRMIRTGSPSAAMKQLVSIP